MDDTAGFIDLSDGWIARCGAVDVGRMASPATVRAGSPGARLLHAIDAG